ncbi:unknown [Firmicutes bacterium CAG:114]|nr:unknown [Firmicutes bacterium CAG:114]
MLNAGGILGLIHTEMGVFFLKVGQNLPMPPENLRRVHHLIVIVHPAPLPEHPAIGLINLGHRQFPGGQRLHLLPGHLPVLSVGDGGPQPLDGALCGKGPSARPEQFPHQGGECPLVGDQLKSPSAHGPLVILNDPGGKAIDGAKLQPAGPVLSKGPGKPGAHIPGGRHRVGHCENPLRGNPPAVHQIAQAVDEHRGFPAARHSQQEHRPVGSLDRRRLLLIQSLPPGLLPHRVVHVPRPLAKNRSLLLYPLPARM